MERFAVGVVQACRTNTGGQFLVSDIDIFRINFTHVAYLKANGVVVGWLGIKKKSFKRLQADNRFK